MTGTDGQPEPEAPGSDSCGRARPTPAAADVLADRAVRLASLTGTDADLASLRDLLLRRASQMADDLPQITELDLSPVIARRDGALAANARIRLQPAKPADVYLRQLR